MTDQQAARTTLLKPALIAAVLLLTVAAAVAKGSKAATKVVNLQDGQGKSFGTATLSPEAKGVSVKLESP